MRYRPMLRGWSASAATRGAVYIVGIKKCETISLFGKIF